MLNSHCALDNTDRPPSTALHHVGCRVMNPTWCMSHHPQKEPSQNPWAVDGGPWTAVIMAFLWLAGCATPQYALRPTPAPEESASALEIERAISAVQAQEFERQGARPIGAAEALRGFPVQQIIDRLRRVTERPGLSYRASLYQDRDPNAAALADGRLYLSTGLLTYLAGRGSRADELAFILGHELAHTVAQHLVKRYRLVQQQQLLLGLLAVGAAAVTRDAGPAMQQAGRVALDAASLLQDVRTSGYSQEQELEADQLGIRYVMSAGFDPRAALALLDDFQRFDSPSLILRTHPYLALRRAYLERYLLEAGRLTPRTAPPDRPAEAFPSVESPAPPVNRAARIRQLREAQRLYARHSLSWQNLQRQIDALESSATAAPPRP